MSQLDFLTHSSALKAPRPRLSSSTIHPPIWHNREVTLNSFHPPCALEISANGADSTISGRPLFTESYYLAAHHVLTKTMDPVIRSVRTYCCSLTTSMGCQVLASLRLQTIFFIAQFSFHKQIFHWDKHHNYFPGGPIVARATLVSYIYSFFIYIEWDKSIVMADVFMIRQGHNCAGCLYLKCPIRDNVVGCDLRFAPSWYLALLHLFLRITLW